MTNKDNLIISLSEVNEFLLNDDRCSKEQRKEIVGTLYNIEQIGDRKWIFYHDWKQYIIDEYNEHNDFIKSYIFKV